MNNNMRLRFIELLTATLGSLDPKGREEASVLIRELEEMTPGGMTTITMVRDGNDD